MAGDVVGVIRGAAVLTFGGVAGMVFAMGFAGADTSSDSGAAAPTPLPPPAAAQAAQTTPECVSPAGASAPRLDPDQAANARAIITAAERAGVGAPGARIGVATALVEGAYTRGEKGGPVVGLRNVPYGHASSIGIFQELAGGGSGFRLTDAQRMNVGQAADRFFTKLKRVDGWQRMNPGMAAQAVQRSAHPTRYGQRMSEASRIVAALGGAKCGTVQQQVSAGSCPATGNPAERGLQPGTLRAMRCGAAQFPFVTRFAGRGGRPNASDHPNGRAVDFMIPAWSSPGGNARGWEVARWFEQHADQLGVTNLIWDDKIWRARSRKWEAYTHPNGATSNPTLRHLDHVHVSTK